MLPKTRQQAWIRGLPGLDKKGGVPLEAIPFSSPTPDMRSFSVTLHGSSELISNLRSLSKQQTKLARLSLTVRTDETKELDNQLQMTDAVIDSITPAKDIAGAYVMTILFNSVSIKMALTANPGPPVNCPPIQSSGVNSGWIFGLPAEGAKTGIPMEIADFTPPNYNKRLIVTLGKPSIEIEDLIQNPTPVQELILVLPDRIRQRYVEFKLWNTKATLLEDDRHVGFHSEMIVCLTGKEA